MQKDYFKELVIAGYSKQQFFIWENILVFF